MRVPRVCRYLIVIALFSSVLSLFLYYNIASINNLNVNTNNFYSNGFERSRFTFGTSRKEEANCSSELLKADLDYPNCVEKVKWLRDHWEDEACFAQNGVNGGDCSIQRYLSSVEHHCPPKKRMERREFPDNSPSLDDLFSRLTDTPDNYIFIKQRIRRLWPSWIEGLKNLTKEYPHQFESYRRKNIIVHLGFLMAETKMNFGSKSKSGGPLGELVQWSDLIASLHALGHNLHVTTQKATLRKSVEHFKNSPSCPGEGHLDLIITDIMGLTRGFKNDRPFLAAHKCKLRLVDSFGTHAEFNTRAYFTSHRSSFGGKKNPWGGHALRLQQYWTFYPHTSDNSFLGFVVEMNPVPALFPREGRKAVLVYGKEKYMWKGLEKVIDTLVKEGFEVHATVADAQSSDEIFWNTTNHGFLSQTNVSALLKSVGAFIGLGFPLEGPAPLEAVASGAVFINARFNPPQSRRNTNFLAEKPTLREWTSQCPYMETLGAPYTYTVDIRNPEELKEALLNAFKDPPIPHVPPEFTPLGMLLRVNDMILRQDFCSTFNRSPPRHELQAKCGFGSCDDVCKKAGLVCEPSFFSLINTKTALNTCSVCPTAHFDSSVHAPFNCTLQSSDLLFSCASVAPDSVLRLCPCRTYNPDHKHFCKACI